MDEKLTNLPQKITGLVQQMISNSDSDSPTNAGFVFPGRILQLQNWSIIEIPEEETRGKSLGE
jgi:hypothetical protein